MRSGTAELLGEAVEEVEARVWGRARDASMTLANEGNGMIALHSMQQYDDQDKTKKKG